jgi:hypothetical protein
MNRIIQGKENLIDLTHNLRTEVLEAISDKDLGFTPGGSNLTFGDLLLQQGGFEIAYTNSFRTFTLSFDAKTSQTITDSAAFKTWFRKLDADLIDTLEQLSDEDLAKPINRGSWSLSAEITFYTYRESVIIFAAKASIYLRALDIALPKQLEDWIA